MLKALHSLSRSTPLSVTRRYFSAEMSTSGPLICPRFVSVEGADIYSRSKPDGIRFRLVSYNILAQVYVKSSLLPHSPSPCLKWKARSQAILTVLQNLDADFLCLQEVDEYDSFYKGNIKSLGYSSIYIQRSGQKRDGCGVFFKDNCAELLMKEILEYNDLMHLMQDISISSVDKQNTVAVSEVKDDSKNGSSLKSTREGRGDPNDPRVRLKRDCVGIMAAFKIKGPFHCIVIVANTHLFWDPEWADVKLAQAKYLLLRLAEFKGLVSDRYECTPSLILAGDFNSIPGDKVYQYLISGNTSAVVPPECLEEAPLPLCSVYAFTGGEPPFTNCTPDFTNTLDYILFSPTDLIKPVSVLELPQPGFSDVVSGLPNYSHPSDHLPIGAEFEITRE